MMLTRTLLLISVLIMPGCWHFPRSASAAGGSMWRLEQPLPEPVVTEGIRGYPAKVIGGTVLIVQFSAYNCDTKNSGTVFLRARVHTLGDLQVKAHRFPFQDAIGEDDIVWEMASYDRARTLYYTASREALVWSHPDDLRNSSDSPVLGKKSSRFYSDRSLVRQIAVIPAYVLT